jgi:hypothetical protein
VICPVSLADAKHLLGQISLRLDDLVDRQPELHSRLT